MIKQFIIKINRMRDEYSGFIIQILMDYLKEILYIKNI
jgi:hypothetical protein